MAAINMRRIAISNLKTAASLLTVQSAENDRLAVSLVGSTLDILDGNGKLPAQALEKTPAPTTK